MANELWQRTGARREIEREPPYDPILAADIGRARAYGNMDDSPLPELPQPVRVEQEEWRETGSGRTEWRDVV